MTPEYPPSRSPDALRPSARSVSPKTLARAIGVSESSMKRWVDEGLVHAARTAGGHRRIALGEAVRFVRQLGAAVVRPDLLDLHDMTSVSPDFSPGGPDAKGSLMRALEEGDVPRVRGIVQALYLSGWSVPAICDGPLRDAMHLLGTFWQHAEWGIVVEHRATDACIQALTQLRLMVPARTPGAPVAVGGAFADDPYLLPSMMAATTLAEQGFLDVNLGAVTPMPVLLSAVRHYRPRLVWITVSATADPAQMLRDLRETARQVREIGAVLAVGGRALEDLPDALAAEYRLGRSMADLAAIASEVVSNAAPI